ncbi:hypothetical protein Fmac_018006 [Flemingia macrophylla]|uniref:phosphopantothenoylcysteine decarboxylase n=1 Tax=Flemingia macrophylla TaxID=520843 RepID=A0ABD1M5J6_9FABA
MDGSGPFSSICNAKPRSPRMARVLLGACGCFDALKFVLLCQEFSKWAKVGAVVTQASVPIPSGVTLVSKDNAEGYLEWADIMVIAPLSPETLGKIAAAHCDDLLTTIARGWNLSKPFYVAPSMEPFMWRNTIIQSYCASIKRRGVSIIPPALEDVEFLERPVKEGQHKNIGGMPEPSEISYTVRISNEIYWDTPK